MIKFPKLHIATSVVNRIMNINDQLELNLSAPQPAAAIDAVPNVPDAHETTGPAIDAALYAPTQPSDADPPLAEAIATKSLL